MKSTLDLELAIAAFRPAIRVWAVAAGVETEDVRQEIALAVWQGVDPACAVPRALGIRRLGADWRSYDAAAAACSLDELKMQGFDRAVEATGESDGLHHAGFESVVGTAEIAQRGGITRRAAQMRLVAQIARAQACGDLFAEVPA